MLKEIDEKILIVEGDLHTNELLAQEVYETRVAFSGTEGLMYLKLEKF